MISKSRPDFTSPNLFAWLGLIERWVDKSPRVGFNQTYTYTYTCAYVVWHLVLKRRSSLAFTELTLTVGLNCGLWACNIVLGRVVTFEQLWGQHTLLRYILIGKKKYTYIHRCIHTHNEHACKTYIHTYRHACRHTYMPCIHRSIHTHNKHTMIAYIEAFTHTTNMLARHTYI